LKKIVIIGATSGIGKELAKVFSQQGAAVGLVGRRTALLQELAESLPNKTYIKAIDIAHAYEAMAHLEELLAEMNEVDAIVVSAGVGHFNFALDWSIEKTTIATNVYGFTAMCDVAMKYFARQGHGHLVGISSIDALRGNGCAPAYAASKAFVSNYLEGLRFWAQREKLPITVTEIQPGFVETPMTSGRQGFWTASALKAAHQIHTAIANKKKHAYITKRWCLVAWIMMSLPGAVLGAFYKRYKLL